MAAPQTSPIGRALADALASLRARLSSLSAPVVIVTPSRVNSTLARRELALATPHIRVSFVTPHELFVDLALPGLHAAGLRREPPGWLRATVASVVRTATLPPTYERVFSEPGWLGALTSTIATLEGAGLDGPTLSTTTAPDAELRDRIAALAALLDAVHQARTAEGIASPRDLSRAALAAIEERSAIPANEPEGVILLGDVHGTRLTFDVLRAYLAPRPTVRIAPGAFAALAPAPLGITCAAPSGTETITVPGAPTHTTLARTLDPIRESTEAVREVLRHVRGGIALDRIALVLPDPAIAPAVRDALARAGIPATFQVGPPLAETEAARFARLVLGIARDGGSVKSLYELFAMPPLRLRKILGADATQTRGRWRRILAWCGAYRGLATIGRAVELHGQQAAAGEHLAAEQRERDAQAHAQLLAAIDAVRAVAARLDVTASTGEHARTLLDIVQTWWPPTADQRALVMLLDTWGRSTAGPRIGLALFAEAIEEALAQTAFLTGSLREQTLRVLSPMQLVGASFDAAIATGLVEGTLPVHGREDPILSDALVRAVSAATGTGLLESSDRMGIERRRFAALRSAAAGSLWIGVPARDPGNGRPLLPGSLLLEMLRESDRTAGYDALEAALVPTGRVATAWPDDPEEAISGGEHLLSRLHGADAELARRARSSLADHAIGRRMLAKLRAEDRLGRGERDPALRAYAGMVDPETLPCPGVDGAPIAIDALRALADGPEAFLRRTMLRATRAPRLDEAWDPVSWFFVRKRMLDAAQAVLSRGGADIGAALRAEIEARIGADLDRAGADEGDVRERLRRMSEVMLRAIVRAGPVPGPVSTIAAAPLAADLPWRVEGGRSRRDGRGLEWVVESIALKTKLDDHREVLIEHAAHGTATGLRAIDLSGRLVEDDGSLVADLLDHIRDATRLVRAGWYPPKVDTDALDGWDVGTEVVS